MEKQYLQNFYNEGFGWVCKSCQSKFKSETQEKARLMTEGEAESKIPVFSNKAMAKWIDIEQTKLVCPNCATEESVE